MRARVINSTCTPYIFEKDSEKNIALTFWNGGITVINICNRKNLSNTEVNNDYEREGYKTFLAMKSVGVPEGNM